MLSLIEKMKERPPAPDSRAQVTPLMNMKIHAFKIPTKVGGCMGADERECPAGWCCHFAYKCCPEDAPNECRSRSGTSEDCYDDQQGTRMNPLLMKMMKHGLLDLQR